MHENLIEKSIFKPKKKEVLFSIRVSFITFTVSLKYFLDSNYDIIVKMKQILNPIYNQQHKQS